MRRPLLAAALAAGLLSLFASGPAFARDYVPGEVIVDYADGTSTSERLALFDRFGVYQTLERISGVDASLVSVSGDPAAVAARLNESSHVRYAEPNYVLSTQATPDDPLFGELYGLDNTGQTDGSPDADIDAPEGWDAAALGGFPATEGVRVGIVDTGIDQDHEDLLGKTVACAESSGRFGGGVSEGSCVDDSDHGTHVAGTIAATANNAVGVAGVSFNSPLVICRALSGPEGSGTTADVVDCIDWAHSRGAKVITMSFGGPPSTTLRNSIAGVWNGGAADGSVLVAAAGNEGDATLSYPAGYPEVVSVAATDQSDAHATFSNTNADVEVAAPGVDVLSTQRGGGYVAFSGTSMATPYAAAVAAVIWWLNPDFTAQQVRDRLDASVDDLGEAGRDTSFGFGRVNLCAAAGGACEYTGGG